jgi:hypothetical protein
MNVKAKGNTFEREVSEKLSIWLTNGKEKRACWRSDTSGASATNWAKKKQEARYVQANMGDIRQLAEKGLYPKLDTFFKKYVVECKHYAKIDFYPPFNKTLTKFYEACLAEKAATDKKAVLILKANNRKVLFCQEGADYSPNINPYFSIYYKTLVLPVYLFDDVVSLANDSNESTGGNSLDNT